MSHRCTVRRALLSVSDKTGIVEFARSLSQLGVTLLSTGGTARLLTEAGIPVTEVSDYTGFPEMMQGRIKTLHPKIHGGILGRREEDKEIMMQHDIQPIDLVVVNLYPFASVVARDNCTREQAIENIDIGGPTMLRAAAKNHQHVAVVVNSTDYQPVLEEMNNNQQALSLATRFDLAVKAFEHSAAYDCMIANYFGKQVSAYGDTGGEPAGRFPRTLNFNLIKQQNLRYGENAHQQAAFYVESGVAEASVSAAQQLQGKALSYNNIADTDAALECVKSFTEPACVIVKHANPCGVATGVTVLEAWQRAWQTDPTSAFGGIIALNRELDAGCARAIIERQFVEVIIAPSVSEQALAITRNKPNIRLLVCGNWQEPSPALDVKRVTGGLLVQDRDTGMVSREALQVVSRRAPNEQELQDALFSWQVAKFVKSNAIVYARDKMTLGIGAGQMSRVYSAKIAAIKATDVSLSLAGAAMASDAFLPFRDGIDTAASAGIRCVIQPGGSVRDDEVIAAADEHDIAMIFTGMRHFRH